MATQRIKLQLCKKCDNDVIHTNVVFGTVAWNKGTTYSGTLYTYSLFALDNVKRL
jgi:hypothetical protein